MQHSKVVLFGVVLIVCGASALARTQGSGKVVTESRAAANVKAVNLAGYAELTIVQGEAEGLSVEAEDNILPLLETTVERGELRIGLKGDAAPTKPVRVKLAVKALEQIQLSGSGKIVTEKLVTAGALDAKVVGSGLIDLKGIDCAKWTGEVVGSGDLRAAGHAKEQIIKVTGSGDYEGFKLATGSADVTVSGSGDCEINAAEKLNVTISGSGDVDYLGSPAVSKMVTGSGAVTARKAGE